MSVPLARATAALAIAATLLTACGDSPDTGSAPAQADSAETGSITVTEGEMFIELSTEELSAGSYTIDVVNDGSATHDLVVERDGEDVEGTDSIAPGDSATLTVDLEPGEYVFYCSIANHRAMGMEVTVTVT
jgi:plastocyanin